MNLNRRNFLFGSAAAMTLAGCSTNKVGLRPLKPGEKRAVAIIGCGKQGRGPILHQFLAEKSVKVVAVCDCDRIRSDETAKLVDKHYRESGVCRSVYDFREINRDPSIDAVAIVTPDHWHAYMAVDAMKHGKDVYCEKPLTFSIEEARLVIEAEKKYGRIFQTGSMQRSWREFYTACMIVRNGFIGDVKYVDTNYGRGGQKLGGPSHPVRFFDCPDKVDEKGVPVEAAPYDGVDWNMWLGPAQWRPYSDQLAPRGMHTYYPMFWRFDDDLGAGYNGDWGAHHLDIAQWGLDMDRSGPYRIIRSDEPYSTNLFHGGRRQFGMKMLFKKPYGDVELYHGPFGVWGTIFYGTNGIVAVNRGKIAVWQGTGPVRPTPEIRKAVADVTFRTDKIVAQSVGKDYGTDATVKKDDLLARTLDTLDKKFDLAHAKEQLYHSTQHVHNFVTSMETRKPTITTAETGARSGTLCLLCNMSYRYDTGFDWDPAKMTFAGCNEKKLPLGRADWRGWNIVV